MVGGARFPRPTIVRAGKLTRNEAPYIFCVNLMS